MSRYIDADTAYALLKQEQGRPMPFYNSHEQNVVKMAYSNAKKILANVPTADVKEVVRGEWGMKNDEQLGLQWFNCSICGRFEFNNSDFCPHCGSSMV